MRQCETRIYRLSLESPSAEILEEAKRVLEGGGLVAFPTETVYGLGANALSADAVSHIFEAKGRPSTNPLIVHVPDIASAKRLVSEWTPEAEQLAQRFWAGPLTLVLPKSPLIPDIVTAGGGTVALRMPAHPIAQALLKTCGFPLAAPSANRSNHLSPTQAEHVLASLGGRVEMILDGGSTVGGVESTVVSLFHSPPRLLRPGLITPSELREVLERLEVPKSVEVLEENEEALPSPGMLRRHYSPHTPLKLVPEESAYGEVQRLLEEGRRVGWLTFETPSSHPNLSAVTMPREALGYASRLFAELHALDALGLDAVLVTAPPQGEAWMAVWDRLSRASV